MVRNLVRGRERVSFGWAGEEEGAKVGSCKVPPGAVTPKRADLLSTRAVAGSQGWG